MKKVCPKCGTENDERAKFCMNCAEKFEETNVSSREVEDTGEENQQSVTERSYESNSQSQVEKNAWSGEDTWKETTGSKEKKPKKKVIIAVCAAAVVLVLALLFGKSNPDVQSISATYSGDTQEGVELDSGNSGIQVTGVDMDGETIDLSGWDIAEPETLKKDSSATVEITYKDQSCELTVMCSSSELVDLDVKYNGDPVEGTVMDSNNEDLTVSAVYKNGTTEELKSGWSIDNPVTLEADSKSKFTVSYEGINKECTITCSTHNIERITAEYDGSTKKGVWLDEDNDGIHVIATYKNGSTEEISGWTVKERKKLKAGKTSKITIQYDELSCKLKVDCTSFTPSQYKNNCESISYESLARDPDMYEGRKVKFRGEIAQVLEDSGQVDMRIDVTQGSYGYWDDTVYVVYFYDEDESKFLEDDIVTFYGESGGLYSYESIFGQTITIPLVYAKYIDRG